jgi:hypothetical protein
VDEGGGLRGEGFAEGGVGVAEGVDGDAGGEVEVGVVLFVPDAHPGAADEREREASVGRDDVPLVKLGGGRGWRRRGHERTMLKRRRAEASGQRVRHLTAAAATACMNPCG